VVLDLVMPGMDGFEILENLKADPETRHIPVVVHTSKTLRASDRERLGDKPAAIVGKLPSDVARLAGVIRSVLSSETAAHERFRA
jgi:CheY-like chemotaxis protein